MDTPVSPLGPDVLERDDLRRALDEHDFAAAFALIKKWAGLSQNKIATACDLTPGKVSNIISGRHHVTSITVIRRIADGLRIPGTPARPRTSPMGEPDLTPTRPHRGTSTLRGGAVAS